MVNADALQETVAIARKIRAMMVVMLFIDSLRNGSMNNRDADETEDLRCFFILALMGVE
jgi:hypothetical protein